MSNDFEEPPEIDGDLEETALAGFWRDKNHKLHRIQDMDNKHLLCVAALFAEKTPTAILLEIEFRGI